MTAAEMTEIWKTAAMAEARAAANRRRNRAGPISQLAVTVLRRAALRGHGDIIKIDVGCVIDGYSSDGGAHRRARHSITRCASASTMPCTAPSTRALRCCKPGTPLKEIYRDRRDVACGTRATRPMDAVISAMASAPRSGARNGPSSPAESDAVLEPGHGAWHSKRHGTSTASAASSSRTRC